VTGHAQGNMSHKTGKADGSHLIQTEEIKCNILMEHKLLRLMI
jgi:hypothetical protein